MKIKQLLFFLLLLSACSIDQQETLDNNVNIRLERAPDILNPIRSTAISSKQIEWQLFMPLLQFDAATQELYPVLAAQKPVIEAIKEGVYAGGRKYTFDLREQAYWDDGQPVNVQDVIFTLKAFLHPEIGAAGLRAFLGFIKDIEIDETNPKRFSVYTDRSMNLAEAVIGTMAIYPHRQYDPQGVLSKYSLSYFTNKDSLNAIMLRDSALPAFGKLFIQIGSVSTFQQVQACGPYQIEDWIQGERIILKKKENWWAADIDSRHQSFQNAPDRLIYHFIQDDATLSTMLKDRKIDVASAIDPDVFDELKNNAYIQNTFNAFTPPSPSYYFIAFNTKKEKLSNPETRKAINHLIDVDELIRIAMNGYAIRSNGPILPTKPYYNKSLEAVELDHEKAQALLRQAGWEDSDQNGILDKLIDGQKTDCSIDFKYSASDPIAEKVGILLKNNAQKSGVLVKLNPLENRKLIEDTRRRDFDLYFSRWSQMPGLDDLRNIWHTDSDRPRGLNKAGFGNAQTDALIELINEELNVSRRDSMYKAIQQQIYDAHPYIFLFAPTDRILVHKRFKTESSTVRPGYFENTFELIN